MKASTQIETNQKRLLQLAAKASVAVAVLLIVVKAYAYWISGSVSILASLLDSLVDSLASTLNLVAVWYAMQPADDKHRFGHGKAESLAGLVQSLFIMGSALFLLLQGIDRIYHPRELMYLDIAVTVMVFSIVATCCLVWFQRSVVQKTESLAIKADSVHYLSDLLANAAIIVALILTYYGWVQADALLAIGVAVYIFYTAIQIWKESVQHLLDRELPQAQQRRIEALAQQHPDVLGVHEIRTRQAGRTKIIQLHLEIDGDTPLWRAHRICDDVERLIRKSFPNCDVLIHQDPFKDNLVDE